MRTAEEQQATGNGCEGCPALTLLPCPQVLWTSPRHPDFSAVPVHHDGPQPVLHHACGPAAQKLGTAPTHHVYPETAPGPARGAVRPRASGRGGDWQEVGASLRDEEEEPWWGMARRHPAPSLIQPDRGSVHQDTHGDEFVKTSCGRGCSPQILENLLSASGRGGPLSSPRPPCSELVEVAWSPCPSAVHVAAAAPSAGTSHPLRAASAQPLCQATHTVCGLHCRWHPFRRAP